MIRLGLHLTLRTGREALTRLLVTAGAVAIGVGLLLCVLGMYHAYQTTIARPCWQCTHEQASPASSASLLWRYREDYYQGTKIERLDVARLAATTPTIPGLTRMPDAGQFYVSPALADLLRTVPADELGDRFPGTLAGTIGTTALSSPRDLVIVIGHTPDELASASKTLRVSAINTAHRGQSTSQFYRFGFAMGMVALLIPMLVLIGTASRLAAARREERYAALRLIGATQGQTAAVASVDAILGGILGAFAGLLVYLLLHPLLADLPLLGTPFFAQDITPTGDGFLEVLLGVPAAAALASLVSLRRVGISPLGVSRKATPPPPRVWRLALLALGLPLFCVPVLLDAQNQRHSPGPAMLSLTVVIVGLMIAGPWLTMQAARLLARTGRSGPAVLAARRLADNPRGAYRSVSGLVLAVMVGTALAAILPAALASQDTGANGQLSNVIRAGFAAVATDCTQVCQSQDSGARAIARGLPPATAASMLTDLSAVPGTRTLPVYLARGTGLVRCADLAAVPALGSCPAGATAVVVDLSALFTDNIAALNRRLPLVDAHSKVATADPGRLDLLSVLASTDGPATLERVRTLLSRYTTPTEEAGEAPKTFGEVATARSEIYLEIQQAVVIVAGLTLLIAGCSLAVAVSGAIIERKRPFTLLRLTGTPVSALYRVVLMETLFPLVAATVLAAAVGFTVAVPVARALAPLRHASPLPDGTYYLTLGCGLLLAVGVILTCLPILRRSTAPDNARFE